MKIKPPNLPFHPFLLLAALLATATAQAIRTDSHVFEGYTVLSDGELEGAAVHWDGAVGTGPTLGDVARPPGGTVIWDLAPDGSDSLYLATGGPGAVFRMDTGTGEMKKVLDPEAPLLRAIHVDAGGRLYAGSSPDGRIYRLSAKDGFPEIYTTLESQYIWSIQADPAHPGALLVATGAPGRILRLPADFKADDEPEVVVEADAVHVSTFAHAGDGTLYYATGPSGHLYRRSGDDSPETLVELGPAEVREIFPGDDGSVRIAVYRSDSTGSPPSGGNANGSSGNGNGNSGDTSNAVDGLPSGIFSIGGDGFVDALLIGSEEKIFSAAGSEGELWIGSDTRGRLYRFADRFDWSLLAESPNGGEVSVIEPFGADSAWIATSNPATVHRLSYNPETQGLYTSDVFDAGQKVRWGALVAAGIGLDDVEWETRSGNRSRPDDSWGGWTPLDKDKVASRPGRFFQYRGRFVSPSAAVRRVELFYQLPNEAPGFRRIEGLPVRLESIPMPPESPGRATLPQLFSAGGNGTSGKNGKKSNGSGPQPFVIHEERGWLSIVWEAFDPNEDELRFRVFLRRLGGENWLLLGEDLDQPFLSLNVAGFESGYYEPRIHASDRMSNPPEMARTAEARGNLILIDNQSPKILPPSGQKPLAFTVRDNFSIISSVSYRLEGSESRALLPRDGIFDSRREKFNLPADAATSGATLFLEATDASGNRAAWSGIVETPVADADRHP